MGEPTQLSPRPIVLNGTWRPTSLLGFVLGLGIVVYLVKPTGGYSAAFLGTVVDHFTAEWQSYGWSALTSASVIVGGTLIGFVLGFSISVLVFRVPQARSIVTPIIAFLAPMPIVIWIPFSIGLLGVGFIQVLLIVVVGAMFTFYLYCLEALADISRSARDVFDIHATKRTSRVLLLYLPKCIESVSSIYRVYLAFAWVAVIISEVGRDEQSGAWTGLGYKFYYNYSLLQSHGLIVSLIVLIASAYLLDRLFYYCFRYFNRWKVERA